MFRTKFPSGAGLWTWTEMMEPANAMLEIDGVGDGYPHHQRDHHRGRLHRPHQPGRRGADGRRCRQASTKNSSMQRALHAARSHSVASAGSKSSNKSNTSPGYNDDHITADQEALIESS